MSSNPAPVTAATNPFLPTTTPVIERANRLLSVRSNPGFSEIMRISQEIVQSAIDACMNYPGWDKDQMAVLTIRQKCAKEHHELLFGMINEAIARGISERRAENEVVTTQAVANAVDQGDYVRQEVLKRFEETDHRVAGSF